MAAKKPLVLNAGAIEQLQETDELSEEVLPSVVSYERRLIGKLILLLANTGFEIEDEELINELNQIT